MRDLIQVFLTAVVVAVAALCTLVQLTDANDAMDRLGDDGQPVVQQVSGDRDRGAPDRR